MDLQPSDTNRCLLLTYQDIAAMAPFNMPSGLYSTPSMSMATLAAVSRQQEQQQPVMFSPAESTLRSKFLQGSGVTAFAPAEKKIEMYSKVLIMINPCQVSVDAYVVFEIFYLLYRTTIWLAVLEVFFLAESLTRW